MNFLTKQGEHEKAAKIGLIKLEHIYYKSDQLYEKTKAALSGKPDKLAELYFLNAPSADVIESLVSNIIKHCSKRL